MFVTVSAKCCRRSIADLADCPFLELQINALHFGPQQTTLNFAGFSVHFLHIWLQKAFVLIFQILRRKLVVMTDLKKQVNYGIRRTIIDAGTTTYLDSKIYGSEHDRV